MSLYLNIFNKLSEIIVNLLLIQLIRLNKSFNQSYNA